MGLEALSRGALEITFIEKDPNACACITENLRRFGILKAHFRLLKGEALTQLLRLAKKGERFDLITIDPPYDLAPQLIPEILQCIDERHLLERGGLLFLEAGKNLELLIQALSLRALHLKEVRRYGRTHLHIFVPMEKM